MKPPTLSSACSRQSLLVAAQVGMTYGGGFVSVCIPVPPPWQYWTRKIRMLLLSSYSGPEGDQLSECVYCNLRCTKVFGYGFLNSTGLNCSFEWIGPEPTLRSFFDSGRGCIRCMRLSFRGLRFFHTDHVRGRNVRWNPVGAACSVAVYWCNVTQAYLLEMQHPWHVCVPCFSSPATLRCACFENPCSANLKPQP